MTRRSSTQEQERQDAGVTGAACRPADDEAFPGMHVRAEPHLGNPTLTLFHHWQEKARRRKQAPVLFLSSENRPGVSWEFDTQGICPSIAAIPAKEDRHEHYLD